MKANSRCASAEKYWRSVLGTLSDNLVMVLMVLHEEYGFGEKRLSDLIEHVADKAVIFDEMIKDDVLDIKTSHDRELYYKSIHKIIEINAKAILPPDVYNVIYNAYMSSNQEVIRHKRATEKANAKKECIGMKQAAAMQQDLQAARSWAMDNQNYSAAFGKRDIK